MHLETYTAEAREDLTDLQILQSIIDELQLCLQDIDRRLTALEP